MLSERKKAEANFHKVLLPAHSDRRLGRDGKGTMGLASTW